MDHPDPEPSHGAPPAAVAAETRPALARGSDAASTLGVAPPSSGDRPAAAQLVLPVPLPSSDPGGIAALLRRRLLVAALLILFIYAQAGVQMTPLFSASALQGRLQWVLAAIAATTGVILWRGRTLSLQWLRAIELVLFALPPIQLTAFQVEKLGAEHQLALVLAGGLGPSGYLFNSIVLCFFPQIVGYGLLIPNTGRRCTIVSVAVALVPMALLVGVAAADPAVRGEHLAEFLHGLLWVGSYMTLAVVIAAFGSARIHTLQRQLRIAEQLGQYRLKERIGSGGMGEVYLAEHVLLKQPCAIKVIRPDRLRDDAVVRRFEREVRTMARLQHPNSVEIYDYGRSQDGRFYFVMEYLPGIDLEGLVRRHGPLPAGRVAHVLSQVCGALREAHAIGLVHRDIKPANIILCHRGGIPDLCKLLDFGLAKDFHLPAEHARITNEAVLTGTPAFMSPEQAAGAAQLDGRSDIYSLGAVAYFLLTGRPPFAGTVVEVLAAHLHETPAPLPRGAAGDDPAIASIVERCLAKRPEDRFQEARELRSALAESDASRQWGEAEAARWWAEHSKQ